MNRRNKFNAKRTFLDGYTFDSAAEARRWAALRLAEKGGLIEGLERQPAFKIEVNGKKVCTYKADFRYLDKQTGDIVVEDVKGVRTALYKLKKKLVEAAHGIEVQEISA